MDPYFTAIDQTVINGITTANTDLTTFDVDYQGDIDVGPVIDFTIRMGASGNDFEFRLTNTTPATKLFIITPYWDYVTQDMIVSMVEGDKYARLIDSSGNPLNTLGKLAAGSSWWKLRKGINKLRITTVTAGSFNYALSYYARYGGL